MLLALDAWEAATGSAASSSTSNDSLVCYRRIQLPLNVQLFHINIGDVTAGNSSRTRFIVDDPKELINLLNEFSGRNVSVSLQTELNEKSKYGLFSVDSVIRVFCRSGNILHRFLCDDGVIRIETIARFSSDEALSEEIVWQRK